MALLFANNAQSKLRVSITAAETQLRLTAGEGARFPNPATGDTFFVTVIDTDGNLEIMEATKREVDTITVLRARDGTTPKGFAAGAVVDHRAVAEVFRRMSVESLMGQPNGVAPLDAQGRLPAIHVPTNLLTTTSGDQRYVTKASAGGANGYLQLDQNAKVPFEKLPTELLTQAEGDSLYIPLTAKGTPNGVPILDAEGKIPASYIAPTTIDLSGYAKLQDPAFPSTISVGGKATVNQLTVLDKAVVLDVDARNVVTSGAVTIMGGAPRGRLTLSTAPPTGTPSQGDEWVQYEN